MDECEFCDLEALRRSGSPIFIEDDLCVFDLARVEVASTFEVLKLVKERLDERYRPDGYTIGWNSGTAAGQEVLHAHLHVVPRFADEPYAGPGIRWWIKQEENRRPEG